MKLLDFPIDSDIGDVVFSQELNETSINISGLGGFSVVNGLVPDRPLEQARFSVRPCHAGPLSASDIICLRIMPSRETFGFVFPITSFRNDQNTDDKFTLIYGHAAFNGFVNRNNLNTFVSKSSIEDVLNKALFLDEIVDERLSVLVVSKEILNKHNVDDVMLELALRKYGVGICRDDGRVVQGRVFDIEEKAINICLPSSTIQSDLQIFRELLINADMDNSEIGRFIQYYQFFEYMITKVFDWGIPEIASANASAWDMKEQLNNMGNEGHRLALIDRMCIPNCPDRWKHDDLSASCKNFLMAVGLFKKEQPWYKNLYSVRNCIIHNQIRMLGHQYQNRLIEVNDSLRRAALETLFYFERPAVGQINA